MKRKFISCLLALVFSCNMVVLSACGGSNNNGDVGGNVGGNIGGNNNSGEKYTVSFEGTSMQAVEVDKNYSLQRPTNPMDKNDSRFFDWYLDSSYTTVAVFPMTINNNTKLYAKYVPYGEFFLMARDNTVGDDVVGFEYNYEWKISGTVSSVVVDGTQQGVSKYSNGADVSYYDHRINSGLLFNDGQIYEYKKGQVSNHIELDEEEKIVNFNSEISTTSQKYQTSSFAKALFTYTEDDIKSVQKDENAYLIKTKENLSSIGATILNNINNPIVEIALGSLPNTEADTSVKVTFDGDKIETYVYDFTINVSAVTLRINYSIDFQKANEVPKIDLPTFENFYIASNEVNDCLTIINSSINAYKKQGDSANKFKVETAVDFGLSTNAINATYAGESKRSVGNDKVDFINLIEVDSDLKNKDLYNSSGLKDVKYVRGNTADGTIYDREKGLLSYGDPVVFTEADRTAIDEYYFLPDDSFFCVDNINSVSTSIEKANTVYSLTLTKEGVFELFDYLNDYATLNPFVNANIGVLGTYDKQEFDISKALITIKIDTKTNSLVAVDMEIDCKTNVKYEASRDFTTYSRASVSVDWSFTVTNPQNSYAAPTESKNLKY